MGAMIRDRDWSSSHLGPIDQWSPVLRTTVQNALNTSFPTSIMWGDELIQIYNDSYSILLGDKHPTALGQPTRVTWHEIWDKISVLLNRVRRERISIRQYNMPLIVNRRGFSEEVYFTFAYSPVFATDGEVVGIMITVAETTDQVVSRRRLKTLGDVGAATSRAIASTDLLASGVEAMGDNQRDIPFAMIYAQDRTNEHSTRAKLVNSVHISAKTRWTPPWISLPSPSAPGGPFVYDCDTTALDVIDMASAFGSPPEELQDQNIRQAAVIPLLVGPATDRVCVGSFVFGLNPTVPFDDDYKAFLTQVAQNMALAYETARDQEEQLDMAMAKSELVRKRIEAQHLEQRAALLDSIDEPFYAIDDQWRVIYANDAARRDPHWSTIQITGQNLWELLPEAQDTTLEEALRQARSTHEPEIFEFESPVLDRSYVIRIFPWEAGLSVAFHDITDRRHTAKALAQSEARFRAVVEASLDVIAITDADGHFEFLSPSAQEVLRRPEDELLGHCLFDLLSESGAYQARQAYTKLRGEPRTSVQFRVSFSTSSDKDYWLSIKARNLLDRDGINGLLLNIRDITDIIRSEKRLLDAKERAEEMTRLKSSILTNLNHEIRTPLTSMIGMANVLSEEISPELRAHTDAIERGGMRLAETLNSVLTLAQIEGEAIDVSLVDIEIIEQARHAVDALCDMADNKGLRLSLEVGDEPLYVRADKTFLASILANLIGNAIKFTAEGYVCVRIVGDEDRVIIEVEDTGIGIGEEFLPHLFDEFRQESTGLARSHEGTGLGLAITRRMVRAMEGTISVFSTKSAGTIFTVTVPASSKERDDEDATDSSQSTTTRQDQQRLETPAILVVEDDETIRSILAQILHDQFQTTVASDAASAIEEAMLGDYDLVLLDIGLPDMTGVEVLKQLRAIPDYEQRPIIALTGYAMPEDRSQFVDFGFTDVIAKPFVPAELREKVQQFL